MPAPRTRARRNWPIGLYAFNLRGTTYYRWRHPSTGKFHGLGADFETARVVATQKNAELASAPVERLIAKIEGSRAGVTFEDACNALMGVIRSRKTGRGDAAEGRSETTLKDYEGYLRRFRSHFGDDKPLAHIGLEDVSDYLDGYGEKLRARQYARGLLIQLWSVAKAKGWAKENWPEQTLDLKPTVKRDRLTLEQFHSIWEQAEPWFGAAMRFALYCDQRRGDVATVPTSAWDGTTLTFVQEKTGNIVKITAGPKLKEAIEDCQKIGKAKTLIRHPREGAVSDDMLTRAFQRIRDQLIAGGHKAWKKYRGAAMRPKRPTWHEVRSLGAAIAKQGNKDSKALAGHVTEQMAKLYLRGHVIVHEAESL